MKTSRIARLTVAVLFIAMLVMQVGGFQGALAATPGVTSVTVSPAAQAAAAALWTHAAMANAKPIPMPVDKGTFAGKPAVASPEVLGAPGSTPAGAADPSAAAIAKAAFAADWQAAGMDALADAPASGTPGVYTSYYANLNNMQMMIPHQMVGRLFISGTFGSGYCSATAISGNNIVTAAHCVYDLTHGFFSSWAFTPAYRNGSAPYGTFNATTCTVLTAWTTSGPYSIQFSTPYDLAVCSMGNNSTGHSLNSMVGFAGRTWNLSYDLNFHDMGYPWNNTNNVPLANAGKYLRLCTAESWEQYTGVVGIGCNLGPGISGGSWMPNYAPYQTGTVNQVDSVNSGYFIGSPDAFGIHFSSANIPVLCSARHC